MSFESQEQSPTGGLAVRLLNAVPEPLAARMRATGMASRLLRPLVNRVVPGELADVTVRSGLGKGLKMRIYPGREKFYWTGLHETEVQESFRDLLRPGMTVWDVGGHIGFTAMMAAREVGITGHVHVFEPHPDNRARLEANLRLNNLSNVTVHSEAVSGERGEAQFHRHESSLMWTLVKERGEDMGVSVNCVTLDDLEVSLGLPDVIKIDVEGAEVDVLKGGRRFLEEHSPQLIVEFSDEGMFAQGADAFQGYRFQRIAARHWTMIKAPRVLTAGDCVGNLKRAT